jgi:hypothetical protein
VHTFKGNLHFPSAKSGRVYLFGGRIFTTKVEGDTIFHEPVELEDNRLVLGRASLIACDGRVGRVG